MYTLQILFMTNSTNRLYFTVKTEHQENCIKPTVRMISGFAGAAAAAAAAAAVLQQAAAVESTWASSFHHHHHPHYHHHPSSSSKPQNNSDRMFVLLLFLSFSGIKLLFESCFNIFIN